MPQLVGKPVGEIGYGLMGLTWRPNPAPEEQAFTAMKAALAAGCNFWNGGEFYGGEYNSLTLLSKYFTKYPEDADKVVLSIKGGLKNMHPDGTLEGVHQSVDNCVKLLGGKKSIDIFECARVDKSVPIETTMKALQECVNAGKIRGIGLSEVGGETIKRAAAVVKIAAVEVEVSLWSLDFLSNGVAQACFEHKIPVVAYSPIGRGMLTGEIKKPEDIPDGDFRKSIPRFQGEAFYKNLELVKQLQDIAKNKGCTPAQLAINWVKQLSQRDGMPEIIPIPGATTESRVRENSTKTPLTSQDIATIETILSSFPVTGTRYGGVALKHIDG